MSVLIASTSNRHPSESWGLPVGDRSNRPMKTPAFAGATTLAPVMSLIR